MSRGIWRRDTEHWTETNFDAVKPGATVQHGKTNRYGVVVEEPDHEQVKVRNEEGEQMWPLSELTWYRRTGAVAIFFTKREPEDD